jgi:predicted nucleic acid-binding protein
VSHDKALQNVSRIFLDAASVIYWVERNPTCFEIMASIFPRIEAGTITAVTSPITLAECLVRPMRDGNRQLEQLFSNLIVLGRNTVFATIDDACARHAADLRARPGITLTDALQVAIAIKTKCDLFLTNDKHLQRINELPILTLAT